MTPEEREKVIEILLERMSKRNYTSVPSEEHNKICKRYLVNRTDEELLTRLLGANDV
jgi:hypothetical protein